jgi:hypothetical protein
MLAAVQAATDGRLPLSLFYFSNIRALTDKKYA